MAPPPTVVVLLLLALVAPQLRPAALRAEEMHAHIVLAVQHTRM
jgi:hypothetical protein